ncbi:V-type proton ATPase subunit H [Aplysia californica]|uniref:V-type proton ATPase subunit H n=1 Tax=Aplysia californica TaxID=6500 RepID=A0ABM0JTX9_APLCA|nr:V-type proton ATPase subunit H [Aplysia californica]
MASGEAASHVIEDLERFNKGGQIPTSKLQEHAEVVRKNNVNWKSYLQGQMISEEVYKFISAFDKASAEARETMLKENPNQFVVVFRMLMEGISRDQTLQYVLTLLDDVLQEDKSRVEIFKEFARKKKESVWQPFFHLLDRDDKFIVYQASRIIAKIACWSKDQMERKNLQSYLVWLKDQIKVPNNEYLLSAGRCLQMMLRIDYYRLVFVEVDGISAIISVLAGGCSFQVQYQLVFCLWCISMNSDLANRMNKGNIIPTLADVLSDAIKEKVTRIVLATFRNLLEKVTEELVKQEHAVAMVQCKVLKHLELQEGRHIQDEDIVADLKFVTETLHDSIKHLSSLDEYVSEVKSGRLEWSPVHRSDRFWHENAAHLNDHNYELLKMLIKLLETSKDPLILSVAAHDIGEYVRYYPRGKNIVEQLGGKQMVMQFMMHSDPNVKYEALIAVQKIMVHNWEYLGKAQDAKQPGFGPNPIKA